MPLGEFDWKHPDYRPIFAHRWQALKRIRAEPKSVPLLRAYYREHVAQFITDWGICFEPRNVERNLPTVIPFVLFPRQEQWIDYVIRKWRASEPGITEKSRECGVTWLSIALSCSLCIFFEGMSIGFGSRKAEYVDKLGDPKSILEKGRIFMAALPEEFRGGWRRDRDAPEMMLKFPDTESQIGGEGGDNIGRGDRRGIYFVDESAHLERPERVEASLSMTTNCRIDISSVNGTANPFAIRRHSGAIEVFTFHWRDDPRKDDEWYKKKVEELVDPVIVAQEIDINYHASVAGLLIPSEWVQSAIDSHVKLQFPPTGEKRGAYDVADTGPDLNAFVGGHGVLIDTLAQWTGKGGDIYQSVQRIFQLCDEHGYKLFRYDADGLGAGVRGDARTINAMRREKIAVVAFRGSGAVLDPEREDVKGRKNEDYFANFKAQTWWSLRTRFLKTHRAVTGEKTYSADELISISSRIPLLGKLCVELSQPTFSINGAGKIVIDKTPDGAHSPNLADAVNIQMAPGKKQLVISDDVLARARGFAR